MPATVSCWISAGEGDRPVTLLDFGCGASHLYEYLRAQQRSNITYSGLDLSPRFLACSRRRFPHLTYYELDILEDDRLPTFDYIVMNGLFNAKCDLSFEDMLTYFQRLVRRVFANAKGPGVQRDVQAGRLGARRPFHVPFDLLASFLPGRSAVTSCFDTTTGSTNTRPMSTAIHADRGRSPGPAQRAGCS